MLSSEGQGPIVKTPETQRLLFQVAELSIASPKHPQRNEDVVVSDSTHGFIGVFDGVGGGTVGDMASRMVKDKFVASLRTLSKNPTSKEVTEAMARGNKGAIAALRGDVWQNPEHRGMATTATVVQVYEEDGVKKAAILHAGDSRVYAMREDGSMVQLTEDDNSVKEAVLAGIITKEQGENIARIIDEAGTYTDLPDYITKDHWKRRGEIYNYFAAFPVKRSSVTTHTIEPDTIYIVATSDGVHDNLRASQIAELCKGKSTPQEIVDGLVSEARNEFLTKKGFRSKPDDVSAVAIKVKQSAT